MTSQHPTSRLLSIVGDGVRIYDLARPMFDGMPQSPNHPPFRFTLSRRHGDVVREDGGSAAAEMIVTGGHVGTHIDALSHVSHCGELYGGISAHDAQTGGRMKAHGVETIAPILRRGVLLDVPAALGGPCDAGYEITPADLEATMARQGSTINEGDVVLIRSGWGRLWDDSEAYVGRRSGVPGVGESGARWLADHQIHAAGADTIAFERIAAGRGHASLPAHRVLLVERGIYIIETLALEELASDGIHEFLFILAPLKIVGGTGSPTRPLAVVAGA